MILASLCSCFGVQKISSFNRLCLFTLIIVIFGSGFGFGVLAGKNIFSPPLSTTVTVSLTTASSNSTSFETMNSKESTTTSKNTITFSPPTSSIVLNDTTTTPNNLEQCPSILPNAKETKVLLSLNDLFDSTDFKAYSINYLSSADSTTAMLRFYLITSWGSWYLDNVSVKRNNGNNQELIINGGFETGSLGSQWRSCNKEFFWISGGNASELVSHSGKYSYQSNALNTGSNEYLTQTFRIESNTDYKIQFYLSCWGQSVSAEVSIVSD